MKTKFNINVFKKLLNESGVVEFTFVKKNGETRHAKGTTNPVILEMEGATPKGAGYELSDETIRYYDLEKGGWRSFCADSLVSVDDAYVG